MGDRSGRARDAARSAPSSAMAVRSTTVLSPTGRLAITMAKLLHGSRACRRNWWAEMLGTDPSSDDLAVPTDQVLQTRETGPVKAKSNCR